MLIRQSRVVANDVIMQCTQRCQGLCDPRQLNPYIVILLARAPQALEASQHVIRLPFLRTIMLKKIWSCKSFGGPVKLRFSIWLPVLRSGRVPKVFPMSASNIYKNLSSRVSEIENQWKNCWFLVNFAPTKSLHIRVLATVRFASIHSR